ncbi:MAG: hypothetical protein AAF558_06995 [Verrucomicrobiota bacterium]
MHRIVTSNELRIIALLSHSGVAEAGDARIWLGVEIDSDPVAYRAASTLPQQAALEDALARRDQSILGYRELLTWWQTDRSRYRNVLRAFRARHGKVMQSHANLEASVRDAHLAWGNEGLERLISLPEITADYQPKCRDLLRKQMQASVCAGYFSK